MMVDEPKGMLQKTKEYVLNNKKEIFFVSLIFLLGFGLRGHLMLYELMFEFDSYYHARMGEIVLTTGSVPPTDPQAYYQIPGGVANPQQGALFWTLTAMIFKVLTLGAPYDKLGWIVAVKFYPALFGALTAAAIYFMGKEMYGPKAGATMAFFAAIVPAFVYRTMAGFFEDDSLGFLWMVIGVYFFAKAVKNGEFNRQTIMNSAIAALFFSIMAWTWGAFVIMPVILIGFVVLSIVLFLLKYPFVDQPAQKIRNVLINSALVLAILGVLASAVVGTYWVSNLGDNFAKVNPFSGKKIDLGSAGQTEGSVFSVSVGEESKGKDYWANKYNALGVFTGWVVNGFVVPGVVFIFILYRLFLKKDDYVTPLATAWILFAIYLAFIKLKFTFYLGIPLAIAAGITVNDVLAFVGERPSFEKKIVAFVLGFIFLVGVAAGAFFVTQNTPNIEYDTGWKESLKWMKENIPKDARLFNWWDEGHWISFIGEKKVSTDNRNMDLPTNSDFARFILAPNEEEAMRILGSRYNPDYVVVSEDLVGKMQSLGIYAYQTTDYSDPRIAQYLSFETDCSKATDALSKKTTVRCGGNLLSEEEYNSLPYKRIEEPNQLLQGKARVFVYRNEAGAKIFIFNKQANDTFIVRLFFDKESLTNFEQVYDFKEVRLFKVKSQVK